MTTIRNGLLPILARTRQRGTCDSCGAAIEWAKHARTERWMPFNAPIVLVAALPLGGNGDESPAIVHVDMLHTQSHFATCPDADHWRRA